MEVVFHQNVYNYRMYEKHYILLNETSSLTFEWNKHRKLRGMSNFYLKNR